MGAKTFAGERVAIIGASIAGLLAARILHESYGEVVLLDGDALPDGAASRKATPHAVHPHGIEVFEGLFPGSPTRLWRRVRSEATLASRSWLTRTENVLRRVFRGVRPKAAVAPTSLGPIAH